jgi:hypothetical protein
MFGRRKTLQVTLVEHDGAAWSVPVVATGAWSTVTVPLSELHMSRSILIPTPYPGLWNYWRVAPVQRGRAGDHIHVEEVERLQLTVTPDTGDAAGDVSGGSAAHASGDDAKVVAVESILLRLPGNH